MISISLMTISSIFLCVCWLFIIYIYPWRNALWILCPFLNCIVFVLLSWMNSLYILDKNSFYQDTWFAKGFILNCLLLRYTSRKVKYTDLRGAAEWSLTNSYIPVTVIQGKLKNILVTPDNSLGTLSGQPPHSSLPSAMTVFISVNRY